MKRLRFRKPFNGVGNAINLIPEGYKQDGKTFEMTDGVETYKVKWEGNLSEGKPNIISASSETMLSENFDKMKHLMGYNSKNTLGTLSESEKNSETNLFKESVKSTPKEEDEK